MRGGDEEKKRNKPKFQNCCSNGAIISRVFISHSRWRTRLFNGGVVTWQPAACSAVHLQREPGRRSGVWMLWFSPCCWRSLLAPISTANFAEASFVKQVAEEPRRRMELSTGQLCGVLFSLLAGTFPKPICWILFFEFFGSFFPCTDQSGDLCVLWSAAGERARCSSLAPKHKRVAVCHKFWCPRTEFKPTFLPRLED